MPVTAASRNVVRRWGAGTAAVVRLLIATDDPLTGVTIASTVGVTQPRASQILKQLADHGAIEATPDGYVGERTKLLDLYTTRARPHLVEPESYWYSTRPLAEQARRVLALASDHGVTVAFSADLAPDLIAPWRHPTVTIAYLDARLPIEDAGLVPAEGRTDASLITRWTDDHGLLSPAAPWRGEVDGLPVADPCQQWWDLLDLGGEDRAEAADRLRTAILDRTIPRVR
jgi:DNA-binding MarR family transcriptional regulator